MEEYRLQRILTTLISAFFWLIGIAPTTVLAQTQKFESGVYENLLLAISKQGNITGYYHEEQGEGVTKSCKFFLSGKTNSNKTSILTWNDKVFPGTISAETDGVTLKIEKAREHPGCGLVLLPQISEGIILDRVEKTAWTELRRISSERTYFHREPTEGSRLRAYIIKSDVVGVLSEKDDWIQVEYRARKGMLKGWVRNKDAEKLQAPPD